MAPEAPNTPAARPRRKAITPHVRAAVRAGLTAGCLLIAAVVWLGYADAVALLRRREVGAPAIMLIAGATVWAFSRSARRALSLRLRFALVIGAGTALLFVGELWWSIQTGGSAFGYLPSLGWDLAFWAPLVVVVLAVTAWTAAGRALRPVEAIRRELEDITARSLGRRVPVSASADEIARLARTINTTLDRLERAAELQQRFVADASHELRSPLAGLRASLESSLTHPEGVDWEARVRDALRDIVRLQNLSHDLLLLAQLDGGAPVADTKVNLTDLAHDLAVEHRHLPHPRPLDIRCVAGDPPAWVRGSDPQLERLLRNLLGNACRYARTTVEVTVGTVRHEDGDTVVFEVRDDGPGIPPADRERVFKRFSRLEDARTRKSGGAGLGLAIAREIAVRHGGTLHFADTESGTCAVGRLPSATGCE
ncbi:HAMP domain-containing sensor histidine kinase [Streptomyces sp. ME19-01-6]|uniref:sensor histidine kinase n=1 Tax=Streptomyces sp. ME19-01-6 TaxID=3028686 RepID=UPI0029BE8669|nr:HAMP domain-containing sensor histidine kinase [Streptomyces sp. ME19-01-6]MDX3228826.1 HAMP domain-containing sensor histidine kinase [Streptomyces sp. ME19-01-6]